MINAYHLQYDCNGVIINMVECNRSIGTAICLERDEQKEQFQMKSAKQKKLADGISKANFSFESNLVLHIIQTYCFASDGITLNCWNHDNDIITRLFYISSTNSLEEKIIEIFGQSKMDNLIQFKQIEPIEYQASFIFF